MNFDIDNYAKTSVTTTIYENASSAGATPECGEVDNRKIWDRDDALCAKPSATLPKASPPDGFQIVPVIQDSVSEAVEGRTIPGDPATVHGAGRQAKIGRSKACVHIRPFHIAHDVFPTYTLSPRRGINRTYMEYWSFATTSVWANPAIAAMPATKAMERASVWHGA